MALIIKLRITCCSCTLFASTTGRSFAKLRSHRNPVLQSLAPGHRNDLEDRFVHRQAISPRALLLDQGANPRDHLAGPIAVLEDAAERLPSLLEIGRLGVQPTQCGIRVCDSRCDGLVDLVGDGSRQLPHYRDPVRMLQLQLGFPVPPFGFARFRFRLLAVGQVDDEGDSRALFIERCSSNQHRHAAAVFPEVLLLVGLGDSDRRQFSHSLRVPVMPFRRRQLSPAQSTRLQVCLLVSDYPEKRPIRLQNSTVESPDQNPDDIRLGKASEFCSPFLKIAIKAGVFQRDCCLRRQQFQDRDLRRRECVRSQCLFEQENPGQFRLPYQRKAEDRFRLPVMQIVIPLAKRLRLS